MVLRATHVFFITLFLTLFIGGLILMNSAVMSGPGRGFMRTSTKLAMGGDVIRVRYNGTAVPRSNSTSPSVPVPDFRTQEEVALAEQILNITCPPREDTLEQSAARDLYNALLAKYGGDRDLHEYSYYQMPLDSWDLILYSHVNMLGYKPGEWLFESGCAAGAALDAISRQFGVRIAGVDIAEALVDHATARLPNSKFCAADVRNISFVPSDLFHHSMSMGVFTYLETVPDSCKAAKELLRVVRPGGTVFMGQINDKTRESLRPDYAEGNYATGPLYWYRFAHDMGISDVRVLRAGEVYSKRKVPQMTTYELHANVRYNVYFRKPFTPLRYNTTDCYAFESNLVTPRETVDGEPCHLPFTYKGVVFDDCTNLNSIGGEWCGLEKEVPENANATSWGYCAEKEYKVREDFWGW